MIKDLVAIHGKQGEKAAKRAFRKTLKWLQSQVATYASKELGISRKAFKQRWFTDLASQTLWLGINPVLAHRAGRARQNKAGVKVSDHQFDGAFLAAMSQGQSLVMRRVGRRRLPIEAEYIEVKDDVTIAFNKFKNLARSRFETVFKQELNYVRNHEKS